MGLVSQRSGNNGQITPITRLRMTQCSSQRQKCRCNGTD
jgi:hypothetical protein